MQKIFIKPNVSQINIGCGEDLSIKELSLIIKNIVGYNGDLNDESKLMLNSKKVT